MAITKEQETILQHLWDKYMLIVNRYTTYEWLTGDVPTSVKRTRTLRFNKYYKYAIGLGYNMTSSIPKQMIP